jgi:hypothetical protein
MGIAVDGSGTVYVTDTGNRRIQAFTAEGMFLRQWGSEGNAAGQFNSPMAIAVSEDGIVYVADTNNHRIQAFTSQGAFVREWGSEGSETGQFDAPRAIAVDKSGTVYVAERYGSRIQAFSSEGTFLRQWGSEGSATGQFQLPWGIAAGRDGTVYVTDAWVNRVQAFAPNHPTPHPVHGLALNGSFEEAPALTCWAYGGELPVALVDRPRHGSQAVQLGTLVPAEPQPVGTAWLRQTMYIRPEWNQPILTFHYRMYVNDILAYSDFYVWLSRTDGAWLDDIVRDGYPGPHAPPPGHDVGWRTASYDLSPYKGQHVRLIFERRNLHGQPGYEPLGIWTLVDDVRVLDTP